MPQALQQLQHAQGQAHVNGCLGTGGELLDKGVVGLRLALCGKCSQSLVGSGSMHAADKHCSHLL